MSFAPYFTSTTNLTEKVTFPKNMRSHQSKVPILTLLCQIEKIPHSSLEDLYLIPHTKLSKRDPHINPQSLHKKEPKIKCLQPHLCYPHSPCLSCQRVQGTPKMRHLQLSTMMAFQQVFFTANMQTMKSFTTFQIIPSRRFFLLMLLVSTYLLLSFVKLCFDHPR